MKYSEAFNAEETKKILELLKECGRPAPDNVNFFWNSKMGCNCIGCFAITKPWSIFVSEDYRFEPDSKDFKKLIGPVAHELRHRWQFFKFIPLYILACLPLIRNLTIEVDAEKVGASVDKFFGISESERL